MTENEPAVTPVITVDAVHTAVAADNTTLKQLAHVFGVSTDHTGLTNAIARGVSDFRLRAWRTHDGGTRYEAVPTGTVDFAVLEYLRAQNLRHIAAAYGSIATEIGDAANRMSRGGTVHSTAFSNLAGRLSDLAARAAAIELIDTLHTGR